MVLLAGSLLFASALGLQILLWRRAKPKGEILGLLGPFLVWPMLVLAGLALFGPGQFDLFAAGLLYFALAGAYIMTYPSLTTKIPSFRILQSVAQAGSAGLTRLEIIDRFDRTELVESRVNLLAGDNLVKIVDQRMSLTPLGSLLAGLFIFYRRLAGLDLGAG